VDPRAVRLDDLLAAGHGHQRWRQNVDQLVDQPDRPAAPHLGAAGRTADDVERVELERERLAPDQPAAQDDRADRDAGLPDDLGVLDRVPLAERVDAAQLPRRRRGDRLIARWRDERDVRHEVRRLGRRPQRLRDRAKAHDLEALVGRGGVPARPPAGHWRRARAGRRRRRCRRTHRKRLRAPGRGRWRQRDAERPAPARLAAQVHRQVEGLGGRQQRVERPGQGRAPRVVDAEARARDRLRRPTVQPVGDLHVPVAERRAAHAAIRQRRHDARLEPGLALAQHQPVQRQGEAVAGRGQAGLQLARADAGRRVDHERGHGAGPERQVARAAGVPDDQRRERRAVAAERRRAAVVGALVPHDLVPVGGAWRERRGRIGSAGDRAHRRAARLA
jgi:hypothetical protein